MKEEQFFVEELKKHLDNPEHMVAAGVVEAFRGFVAQTVDTFLGGFENKDLDRIEQMLNEQRRLRKVISREIRRYPDEAVVVSCKYVQTYNLMNKMVQSEKRRRNIADTMALIEQTYTHTRKVLIYLYRHTNVQHGVLVKALNIPKSSLSDLLKVLEKAGCVERIQNGKCSFFNLTVEGRKYVKETIHTSEQEVIIDQRVFRSGVQQFVEVKADQDLMRPFPWRVRSNHTAAVWSVSEEGMKGSAKWKSYAGIVEGVEV